FGGQGNDIITGGSNADLLFGDRGRVEYLVNGQPETILGNGGPGDRTNAVQAPADLIFTVDPTVGGDDTITGGPGSDIIFGGTGAGLGDVIKAGEGNNIAIGDSGRVLAANGHPAT